MTSNDITRLYQFMMEEFTALRAEMNNGFARFENKFDGIYVQLDGIRGKLDDIEVEQVAQNAQLNRHEDTLQILVSKVAKLEPQV